MEESSDKDESLPEVSSSDDSDSDAGPRGKNRKTKLRYYQIRFKITSIVYAIIQNRVKPLVSLTPVAPKIKKNNIWASGLQEESLMENLKGCGVDQQTNNYDRSVESYDYSIKYRLNGENALKRRQSTNSDSSNDQQYACFNQKQSKNKRFRANSMGGGQQNKRNVRQRLGVKSEDSSSNDGNLKGNLKAPREIIDLNEFTAGMSNEEIARDFANKLYEEKDELMRKLIMPI